MITESLILGLSTGSACVTTCGMVMFPYLMSNASNVKKITFDLSIFMITRFLTYFVLANISWYLGQALFSNPFVKNVVPAILYIILSAVLIYYSITAKKQKNLCPAKTIKTFKNKKSIPILLGIINSLGFCPAIFIILTKGATQSSLIQSYLTFVAFFIGSSVWFLPLPLAGKIKKVEILKTIGILATGLAGIIFMITGITNLLGEILYG